MLVFAPQNLVEDPPFTKLDLLSCRNLLIYFDAKLQQRLMPDVSLRVAPGRPPLSRHVGGGRAPSRNLFEPLDKKWKIFRRKDGPSTAYVTGSAEQTG